MPDVLQSERLIRPERTQRREQNWWYRCLGKLNPAEEKESFVSTRLSWIARHQLGQARMPAQFDEEVRSFALPLVDVFRIGAKSYPSISVDPEVMAGAPCIRGTRIPVYMILDAIEYHGTLQAALESYPRLTVQQVKDAIGFAKLVVECPVEHETSPAT